jgi:membrane-bound lytic murein transglycosylase A
MAAPVSLHAHDRGGRLSFHDLAGWAEDDHLAALRAFRLSAERIRGAEWAAVRSAIQTVENTSHGAQRFFETWFSPHAMGPGPAFLTGYYEPEFPASLVPTSRYAWPIYQMPPEISPERPWYSRAEIETGGHLAGSGLEIAWLSDPVDVFFLMVQGSGRLRLESGDVLRVGFAGKNGHPYKSIGKALIARGECPAADMSAQTIRNWIRLNPTKGAALLRENPSYVFFADQKGLEMSAGPIGTQGVSLTAMRSVAVDPDCVTLGAPVWVETDCAKPIRSLMIAQDTGAAIKGAHRGDIFFGSGFDAGEIAGRFQAGGRMLALLPRHPDQTCRGRT